MSRRLLLSVLLVAACSHDMDDREYCTRRQMAWEMAFPNLPQTDTTRKDYVDECVAGFSHAAADAKKKSIACMNEHLVGKGHAEQQWTAFEKCEGTDPTR